MNRLFPCMFCIALFLWLLMPLNNAEGGGFSATGSMTTERDSHTATLLSTGKTLITGGYGYEGSLSSAELYDPVTETFNTTGSMVAARYNHTATLLSTGKVLISGGYGYDGSLSSAELYDPVSGTFSSTGSMTTARENHTAILLSSGKVLISGGNGYDDTLNSAELYDPSTGTFGSTGSMTTARENHTAILLSTGKVLITGGDDYGGSLSNAELYDPVSGTFSSTGSMTTARENHTAILLSSGKVLIAGGNGYDDTLNNAELYNPATGTFSSTGNMATIRSGHTATLLSNGEAFIAGGDYNGSLSSTELYNPATGTFSAAGSMIMARYYHIATLLSNGKVLITGGWNDNNGSLGSAELYAPAFLPTISGAPATTAIVGVTYSFTPISTNAEGFSISGSLPPGIVFNSATGALSGIPTTVGVFGNIIITVTNANGSASLPAFSITVISGKQLTVNLAGAGSGKVDSITSGVTFTCTQGACPKILPYNTIVTLSATPSSPSLFGGWSGACTNTSGDCQVTLDTDRSVTATFTMPPLKIPGLSAYYYNTFTAALADTTAMPDNSSVTLYGQATTLTGGFILNRPVNINFAGGFDAGFLSNTDGKVTVITGGVRIRNGSLKVKNLVIR